MNSLSHHYNLFEATDFVLSGSSAGAFGVGLNCDDVAEWLQVIKDLRPSGQDGRRHKHKNVCRPLPSC